MPSCQKLISRRILLDTRRNVARRVIRPALASTGPTQGLFILNDTLRE